MRYTGWGLCAGMLLGCTDRAGSEGSTGEASTGTVTMSSTASASLPTSEPATSTSASSPGTGSDTFPLGTTGGPSTGDASESGGGGAPMLDVGALQRSFPGACVPPGVTSAELEALGILAGDGSAWSCALVPGEGNGSGDFDGQPQTPDNFPTGIALDPESCAVTGAIDPALPFGIHAWITTFTQSGTELHVPHCAPQGVRPVTAYTVLREDGGVDATLVPIVQLLAPDQWLSVGSDAPDPKVTVMGDETCKGIECFYAFVFAYNALSEMASVSANPNAKFPAQGFQGFTHALRVQDVNQAQFVGRAWVVNVTFDYCIAKNAVDCGNTEEDSAKRAELIRANGGDSHYRISLVLLPE